MEGKKRYIHIGYPKNLSTTLQRDFFGKHPQIFHLGIGVGSNVDYINPQISSACENHLVYSRDYSYNRKKTAIKKSFHEQFDLFEKSQNHKICGISLEHISFSFTPDNIDITTKAERLADIFDGDAKIIMIIREQNALLKSLYRESIRMGYPGEYSDFMNYSYLCQDRNFLLEFMYDYTYELFAKYFGKENIILVPVEDVRGEDGNLKSTNGKNDFVSTLCNELGIDYFDLDFDHHNKTLSEAQTVAKKELNKTYTHDLGNCVYGNAANFHRLKHYFIEELKFPLPDELLYYDARVKNKSVEEAIKLSADSNKKIDYSYSDEIKNRLNDQFRTSNKKLELLSGKRLPGLYTNDK